MQVRLAALDRCPFDWPALSSSDQEASTSAGSPQASRTQRSRVWSSQLASESVKDIQRAHEITLSLPQWFRARYYECLWLGEHHFPLADFPLVLNQFQRRARRDVESATSMYDQVPAPDSNHITEQATIKALTAIASILRSRSQIQKKFRQEMVREGSLEAMLDLNLDAEDRKVSECLTATEQAEEQVVIKTALRSGQGAAVGNEIRRNAERLMTESAQLEGQMPATEQESQSETSQPVKLPSSSTNKLRLRDEWLAAMERRELSLQLLLVLEALRLSVECPGAITKLPTSSASSLPMRPTIAPLQKPIVATATVKEPTDFNKQAAESTSSPSGLAESRQFYHSQDLETSSSDGNTTKKKRKRKSAPARRWTGISTTFGFDTDPTSSSLDDGGFPWLKRPHRSGNSSTPAAHQEELAGAEEDGDPLDGLDLLRDVERLHKHFESLIDRLSLRIVTADLAKDLSISESPERQSLSSSESVHCREGVGSKKVVVSFGTSARRRDDRDERDELHYLCSDIVEPRFSRLLPRQCSILHSRATGGTSATPARPVRNRMMLSSDDTSPSNVKADQLVEQVQRKKEDALLKEARTELDLVSKGKAAAAKAKEREARKMSQRPALKEALSLEQRERRGSRASSTAADAERSKREVSVKRRVGFGRSSSLGGDALATSLNDAAEAQDVQKLPAQQGSDSLRNRLSIASRTNKRKIAEPQRFGGLPISPIQSPSLRTSSDPTMTIPNLASKDEEDDNPFRDVRNTVAAGAISLSSVPAKKKLIATVPQPPLLQPPPASKGSAFSRSASFARTSSQIYSRLSSQQSERFLNQPDGLMKRPSRGDSINDSLPVADPLLNPGRSASAWQRTESQPVTSRDLSALSNAPSPDVTSSLCDKESEPRRIEEIGEEAVSRSRRRPLKSSMSQPVDLLGIAIAARSSDDGSDVGDGDVVAEEVEEEEEEMLVFNRRQPSSSISLFPSISSSSNRIGESNAHQVSAGSTYQRMGGGGTRTFSRTASGLSALRSWTKTDASALPTLPQSRSQSSRGSVAVASPFEQVQSQVTMISTTSEAAGQFVGSRPTLTRPPSVGSLRSAGAARAPTGRNPFAKAVPASESLRGEGNVISASHSSAPFSLGRVTHDEHLDRGTFFEDEEGG